MRVEKRGDKWIVTTEDGSKVLGTHDTKADAEAQLRAIEASKARAMNARPAFATVPSFRFSLDISKGLDGAIGKWSRGATFGYKGAKGEGLDFTLSSLTQMVDNAASRGDRISICQDHLSILGPPVGRPAPSLGFFYGLALFDKGKLVKSWAYDGGQPPDGVDEKGQPRDGLYCRLGEITPLGRDTREGLANYSSLSPAFPPPDQTTDESGNPIGYALLDFAATSTPFQAGCELQLHRLSIPTGERALNTGVPSMNPEMMKRMGFAEDAKPTVAEKMAAYSKHAMDKADGDDLKAMADDLEKHEEPEAKEMAAKFKKLGAIEEPKKLAADADGDEEKAKAAMAAMFGVSPTSLTFSAIATHMAAKTVPAAEVATLKSQVATMSAQIAASRDEKIGDSAKQYVETQIADGRADAKASAALINTFSRAAAETHGKAGATRESIAAAGAAAVEPFLLTKGTLTLGKRVTAGGHPIGKPSMPVTSFAADSPDAIEMEIAKKAREKMKADKTITMAQAQRAVLAADPALAAQFRALSR